MAASTITDNLAVKIHGGHKIHAVYTTDSNQVTKTLLEYEAVLQHKVGRDRFVGLDFEYTNNEERSKKVDVIQLALVSNVLVFQW